MCGERESCAKFDSLADRYCKAALAVMGFTEKPPLKMEEYFSLFPELLQPLRIEQP
jgi:hypothetical protein